MEVGTAKSESADSGTARAGSLQPGRGLVIADHGRFRVEQRLERFPDAGMWRKCSVVKRQCGLLQPNCASGCLGMAEQALCRANRTLSGPSTGIPQRRTDCFEFCAITNCGACPVSFV